MMTVYLILLGVLIGSAISDIVFDYRIYSLFPQQSRRWWPGSGYWMMWKTALIARNARNRLLNVHALAQTFPVSTAHRDATRAFVSSVKKFTDVGGAAVGTKVDEKREVSP